MVHRDLKPSNLMVNPGRIAGKPDNTLEATVKVLDIGLGRELFDEDTSGTQDMQLTSEGALLGTPDYLAPEQARDARTADIRADIYSMGCVLYRLIAGQTPFPDKNVMSQMVRHATEVAAPLTKFTPSVNPALVLVVKRLMEKDPARRPSTPAEAAELLRPHLPTKARQAEKIRVLPAFQEWLESESMMEMPPATVPSKLSPPPEPPQQKPIPTRQPTKPQLPVRPVQPRIPGREEISVELVTLPPPMSVPVPVPAPREDDDEEDEPRPLIDLDRRDFIMLGTGAMGILIAIGLGFGLSRMMRKKELEDQQSEK